MSQGPMHHRRQRPRTQVYQPTTCTWRQNRLNLTVDDSLCNVVELYRFIHVEVDICPRRYQQFDHDVNSVVIKPHLAVILLQRIDQYRSSRVWERDVTLITKVTRIDQRQEASVIKL